MDSKVTDMGSSWTPLTSMSYAEYIPWKAEYGSELVAAPPMAVDRGTGNWNPSPANLQTVNRGNSLDNAWGMYAQGIESPGSPAPTGSITAPTCPPGPSAQNPLAVDSWDNAVNETLVGWASRATGYAPNNLMTFFFSRENIDYLQQRFKDETLKIKNVQIADQNENELLQIMLTVYMDALQGTLPNQNNKGTECGYLEDKLSRVNKTVIEEGLQQILGGINMYKSYHVQNSSLPLPLAHPTLTTMKGSNVLSPSIGIEDDGHLATTAIDSFNMRYNIT